MYTKTDFWSKILADKGGTPFSCFAFLLSVNFFCDMFFAACIKYKDSVLCRQPDKNVTFATMVHKYPGKSGGRQRPSPQGIIYHLQTNTEVFNLRICKTSLFESILACAIVYWFWEFSAPAVYTNTSQDQSNNVQFNLKLLFFLRWGSTSAGGMKKNGDSTGIYENF